MPRPLKVYRTSIGFHDAYVAASSQKAALAAWGATNDLFGIGSAEVVTDPAMTAEALAAPGKVIKRLRGSVEEHLAAAGPSRKAASTSKTEPKPAKPRKPPPHPSRDKLDQAEAVLAKQTSAADAESSELLEQEAALRRKRELIEQKHAARIAELERRLQQARDRYDHAMDRWRAS